MMATRAGVVSTRILFCSSISFSSRSSRTRGRYMPSGTCCALVVASVPEEGDRPLPSRPVRNQAHLHAGGVLDRDRDDVALAELNAIRALLVMQWQTGEKRRVTRTVRNGACSSFSDSV